MCNPVPESLKRRKNGKNPAHIRKLKPPQHQPLDEQLWPVIVALVVLGGFTMGSLLAYLRYDDPRWYANSLTWLVVAALLFGGAAVALTLVDNRTFRRSMQLAILLGLLLHAVLLVVSFELEVFGRAVHVFLARNDLTERRQAVTIPDYVEPAPEPHSAGFPAPGPDRNAPAAARTGTAGTSAPRARNDSSGTAANSRPRTEASGETGRRQAAPERGNRPAVQRSGLAAHPPHDARWDPARDDRRGARRPAAAAPRHTCQSAGAGE